MTLSEELDTIQTRIVSKLGESHDAEKALAEEYRKKGEVSFEHLKHVKDSITAEQLSK